VTGVYLAGESGEGRELTDKPEFERLIPEATPIFAAGAFEVSVRLSK
jgi:hypothetical protein